jgi:hypothetical protein
MAMVVAHKNKPPPHAPSPGLSHVGNIITRASVTNPTGTPTARPTGKDPFQKPLALPSAALALDRNSMDATTSSQHSAGATRKAMNTRAQEQRQAEASNDTTRAKEGSREAGILHGDLTMDTDSDDFNLNSDTVKGQQALSQAIATWKPKARNCSDRKIVKDNHNHSSGLKNRSHIANNTKRAKTRSAANIGSADGNHYFKKGSCNAEE